MEALVKSSKPIEKPLLMDYECCIDNMPDEILCYILCFLPTRFAAATTFLSTRWKSLFVSIPNLKLIFDDSIFLQIESNQLVLDRRTHFINYMYSMLDHLLSNVACIDQIVLHCGQVYDNAHLKSWLGSIVRFDAIEFSISIANEDFLVFPQHNFCCTNLVKLSLNGRFILNIPSSLCLPNLDLLYLKLVKFRGVNLVQRLFRGCPRLQESQIEKCHFDDMHIVEISNSSLKTLKIFKCTSNGKYEVVLNTPALCVLEYYNEVANAYSVKNLGSLFAALLDIAVTTEQWAEDGWSYYRNIVEFVATCSHVDILYLSHNCIMAINASGGLLPTFSSLCILSIDNIEKRGWKLLPRLLESSPNLEILVFTGISEYIGYAEFVSCITEHVPMCFSSSLYKIVLEQFNWEENDITLVEFFLKTSKVLKKMKIRLICSDLTSVKQLSLSAKLLMLAKWSTLCQVDVKKGKTKILQFSLM